MLSEEQFRGLDRAMQVKVIECATSSIREYAMDRRLTPEQVYEIFHEGIVRVIETYPPEHPLRVAVANEFISDRK